MVQAVIMAGGPGMRLRPHTDVLPKPLTPIDDRPIIEIVIRALAARGIEQAVVCLGAKSHLVRTFLSCLTDPGLDLQIHEEREPNGTAGALREIVDRLEEDVLVLNADVLADADLAMVMARHRAASAAATLAVATRETTIRYGVVDSDEAGRVTAIREKPSFAVDVSLGISVLRRDAAGPILVATAGRLDMPDLMARMIEGGRPVIAVRLDCRWFDIGEEADLRAARAAFANDPEAFLGRGAQGLGKRLR